ncbi:MAG: radical SAM protein, partial [Bacilli bacterium]|nr:radical SAM protein [Bacilli bacterium]
HLHIPLQAGADTILKKMNRKYDTNYFAEKIETIRQIRPGIAITTDIIVGHPFETETLFQETLDFAKKIQFAKIHVFPYSAREGTKAAQMPMQVEEKEKKRRVKELIALSNAQELAYYNQYKNVDEEILVEVVRDGKSYGHTSNYLYVELDEELEVGKIYSRVI